MLFIFRHILTSAHGHNYANVSKICSIMIHDRKEKLVLVLISFERCVLGLRGRRWKENFSVYLQVLSSHGLRMYVHSLETPFSIDGNMKYLRFSPMISGKRIIWRTRKMINSTVNMFGVFVPPQVMSSNSGLEVTLEFPDEISSNFTN